jgi:protein arginine N-methyltransferase 5
MEAAPLIIGLYRGSTVLTQDSPSGLQELWLRDQWRENLGNGYNFTLIPLLKDLDGLDAATLDVSAYDSLPQAAFTRKAHQALRTGEWQSIGGVLNGLARPGLSLELVEHMFNEAAQWVKYLGMHSVTFDLDALADADDKLVCCYAGIIARLLQKSQYEGFHVWVQTSLDEQGWHKWNLLRNTIAYMPKDRVHVLPAFMAGDEGAFWKESYQRWFGENIQALVLPTTLFQAGVDGRPVLSPTLQKLCSAFLPYHPLKWLVEGPCLHKGGYAAYCTPLEAIHNANLPGKVEAFLRYSSDELLRPMQPLQDQLHSSNYEFFEQDPVKYVQYQRAISAALHERHGTGGEVVLMVLGAGRGPLVDAAIRAAEAWPGKLRLFAIEKNPTALVTLKHRANDDWAGHNVTVVGSDMREWHTDERADLIVSELLGSWGDNELSPECLDGANHLLKENGISIPQSYTSYLAPVSSARLHNKVAALVHSAHTELDTRRYFETTFVVKRSMMFPLAEEQPCFSFEHPNAGLASNARFVECRFQLTPHLQECTVHGFCGTFSARLYGDIYISIAQARHSAGMFCWFPLFIPLAVPLTLPGGSKLPVQVWRRVSSNRVWYEWQVPGLSAIHNPGGRSSSIGLH